jgi:hypothetical protein
VIDRSERSRHVTQTESWIAFNDLTPVLRVFECSSVAVVQPRQNGEVWLKFGTAVRIQSIFINRPRPYDTTGYNIPPRGEDFGHAGCMPVTPWGKHHIACQWLKDLRTVEHRCRTLLDLADGPVLFFALCCANLEFSACYPTRHVVNEAKTWEMRCTEVH